MNPPSESTRKSGEGLVVTEDGKRVSGAVHPTRESADREAAVAAKRQITEKGGQPVGEGVKVKQQIMG